MPSQAETVIAVNVIGFVLAMLLIWAIAVAGAVFLGLCVYNDARYRQNPNAGLWGVLSGFFSMYCGVRAWQKKDNDAYIWTGLFWFALGIVVAFGQWLPSIVSGIIVAIICIPAALRKVKRGNLQSASKAEQQRNFKKIGMKIFIPAFGAGFFSIIIVSLVFRYERLTASKVLGCLMGLLGVIVMNLTLSGGASFHFVPMGEGLVLMSAISLAVSGILVKKYSSRFSVVMLSGYQFILGGAVMIAAGLLLGGRIELSVPPYAYALLVYMALISAVAYSVWGILMKYNPVSRVSIFSFLTPLCGVVLSAIFLGEVEQALQLNKLLALLLVSAGIFVVNRKQEADA